jgi:hypothetical protein
MGADNCEKSSYIFLMRVFIFAKLRTLISWLLSDEAQDIFTRTGFGKIIN